MTTGSRSKELKMALHFRQSTLRNHWTRDSDLAPLDVSFDIGGTDQKIPDAADSVSGTAGEGSEENQTRLGQPSDDGPLRQLISLSEQGFKLFPLVAKLKIPMADFHWKAQATCNAVQLNVWYESLRFCNWAARTGASAGFFALDVDGERGCISLLNLMKNFGQLPETLTVITCRPAGRHLYFRYPEYGRQIHNSQSTLAPGLDIRGQGGYVVIPPSISDKGIGYSFVDSSVPIASPPEWLLSLLTVETHSGEVRAVHRPLRQESRKKHHRCDRHALSSCERIVAVNRKIQD
jgi:hypothetical protein